MDILIPDIWLRYYLTTKATPKQLAKYLSLCGPSVEKITGTGINTVYSIEVTTNRVDSASVYGIAREANAILPRFGFLCKLKPLEKPNLNLSPSVHYLRADVDSKLCPRFCAVLIKNVKVGESPKWIKDRLTLSGVRPINNVVDISNFIMLQLGQPVHTFDYDKITGAKMILRASRKREKITTLDDKTFVLNGGDIVIEDGARKLIDLAGIMGGKNSAISESTKNVLLFIQTYNPVNIRKTSMSLAQRTTAAMLFEKGLDPEIVPIALEKGIQLFKKFASGIPERQILDIYPKPPEPNTVTLTHNFINTKIGISIPRPEIIKSLTALGFSAKWQGEKLQVKVPSYRANDITIPEDIVEEVARIYGYHNLPDTLMTGRIPPQVPGINFDFEYHIKTILKGYGGIEVYTYSLVPQNYITGKALRLKNPLGQETEYLRTSLLPSLIAAAKNNLIGNEQFHLFEIANCYLPQIPNLPEERLTLAGISNNSDFRNVKGIVEALLSELNIKVKFEAEDFQNFIPSHRIKLTSGKTTIGQLGVLETDNLIYYEFSIHNLIKNYMGKSYTPIPKYPAQIEDLTIILLPKTKVEEVMGTITSIDKSVTKVELREIYNDAYTFRIWYQDASKTLTNQEVEVLRNKIITNIKTKFGGTIKV